MMKILDRIGLVCLLTGFPTAMAIFILSDPTSWRTMRGKASSVFFLITGMITAVPFGLGFAWFSFEDWRDDRNAKAWNKGE